MALSSGVRSVSRVIKLAANAVRPGFRVWRMQAPNPPSLDPYLQLDWFEAAQPTFLPHPHAGFSAVTMMLEGSKGSVVNRDSFGDRSILTPGDTHWTCAGSGMMHEELPETPGVPALGLQIFVNLAPEHKESPPKVLKLHAADVPTYTTPTGARVRVIAGEAGGLSSPLNDQLLTKVTLLDLTLPSGASFSHTLPPTHNAFSYVLTGGPVAFGETEAEGESFVHFGQDGASIEASRPASGSAEASHFVLFAGQPIGAPVVWKGSVCANTAEQAERFVSNFRAGLMGALEPSPVWKQ